MRSLKKYKIFVLLALGLLVRLVLALLPGFKVDVESWFAWALRLNELGLSNFYTSQIWTNYTPGYLYFLYFLGFIKNFFVLSDSQFYYLLKFPAILSEITLGYLIFQEVKHHSSEKWAYIASSFILFNPALIFNSSIWGQIDGLLALAMFVSISALHKKKLILSSIFLAVAFLIKPQAIALIPVFVLHLLKNLSLKNFLKLFIPAFLIITIFIFPFFSNSPFNSLLNLFSNMVGDYPYTSLFAYNFWGIFSFWTNDGQKFISLSLQNWGNVLFLLYWLIILYFYFKRGASLFSLAALATLGFYFLPTRVHERYLYPAIPLLIIAALQLKNKLFFLLISLLNLVYFLNLYYVYVYYNEFYFKMPKTLYFSLVYNLVGNFSILLSFLATINFILITLLLLRHATKENTAT